MHDEAPPSLLALAGAFLKMGFIAFGGPAAHLALMEQELVNRKSWLSRERFLDMLAVTNLIPGPNSTELALYIGYMKKGVAGLLITGAAFILPSAFLTGLLAWVFMTYGTLPSVTSIFAGLHPVVIALIAMAFYRFLRKAITTRLRLVVFGLVAILYFCQIHPVIALFIGGLVHLAAERIGPRFSNNAPAILMVPLLLGQSSVPVKLGLFLSFFKIGFLLFGSGYVLLPYMQAEFVDTQGLITADQLTNAIAAGQITPGPILCAATFVGYVIDGIPGASLATLGIFLPAFILVALVHPLVPRLKKSASFSSFLSGAVAGSVALILGALFDLGKEVMLTPLAWIIAVASFAILWWKSKLSPAWLMLAGGVVGYVATHLL